MKNLARKRIAEIGLPAPRNDDWIYFPTSKVSHIDIPEVDGELEEDTLGIASESNVAALFPIAFAASMRKQTIAAGSKENGILKIRDEFAHSVFEVEDSAELNLEVFGNHQDRPFSSERIDIKLADNAKLNLFMHENDASVSTHLRHFKIEAGKNAVVRIDILHTGSGVSRSSFDIALNGEAAEADFRSLSVLGEKSSNHSHLRIHHNAPATRSNQFARNILSGEAYASYDGSVSVSANCTDAFSSQLINTILQNEGAKVSVKPVLKIYHDAVECTHGNTCGSLDEDELFYMESRGFTSEQAKLLLSRSFAREVFLGENRSVFAGRIFDELAKLGL